MWHLISIYTVCLSVQQFLDIPIGSKIDLFKVQDKNGMEFRCPSIKDSYGKVYPWYCHPRIQKFCASIPFAQDIRQNLPSYRLNGIQKNMPVLQFFFFFFSFAKLKYLIPKILHVQFKLNPPCSLMGLSYSYMVKAAITNAGSQCTSRTSKILPKGHAS